MKKLILAFVTTTLCLSQTAHAQDAGARPLQIPENSALPLRSDTGHGLCAQFTRFETTESPVSTSDQAKQLLRGQKIVDSDGEIIPKETGDFLIPLLNLNDPSSNPSSDFIGPQDPDIPFPLRRADPTIDGGTLPVINYLVARFRGYIQIAAPTIETWVSNCNDGCRIWVGGVPITSQDIVRFFGSGPRFGSRVQFTKAGLYPIEVIYFVNFNDGAGLSTLELSRANGEQPDGSLTTPVNTTTFKLIPTSQFYTLPEGHSLDCKQCASNADCNNGRFCNANNLCEACNTDSRCGTSCNACSDATPHCNASAATPVCVQCVVDSDCPTGQRCNAQKACEVSSSVDAGVSSNFRPDGDISGTGGCSVHGTKASTSIMVPFLVLGALGVHRVVRKRCFRTRL